MPGQQVIHRFGIFMATSRTVGGYIRLMIHQPAAVRKFRTAVESAGDVGADEKTLFFMPGTVRFTGAVFRVFSLMSVLPVLSGNFLLYALKTGKECLINKISIFIIIGGTFLF